MSRPKSSGTSGRTCSFIRARTAPLSVREAARLQSFPDRYEFLGAMHVQQQQVADAVPPLLAKAVAELVVRGLARQKVSGRAALARAA